MITFEIIALNIVTFGGLYALGKGVEYGFQKMIDNYEKFI